MGVEGVETAVSQVVVVPRVEFAASAKRAWVSVINAYTTNFRILGEEMKKSRKKWASERISQPLVKQSWCREYNSRHQSNRPRVKYGIYIPDTVGGRLAQARQRLVSGFIWKSIRIQKRDASKKRVVKKSWCRE